MIPGPSTKSISPISTAIIFLLLTYILLAFYFPIIAKWIFLVYSLCAGLVLVLTGITIVKCAINGNRKNIHLSRKLLSSFFQLDANRSFVKQVWQGISRITWEFVQCISGLIYFQWMIAFGKVQAVQSFGGVTFVIFKSDKYRRGVSLGNTIGVWTDRDHSLEIEKLVIKDELLMHEYGHTFDSQLFGPLYLPVVGIPSASGARWTEIRANRFAANYFKKYYRVEWKGFSEFFDLNA